MMAGYRWAILIVTVALLSLVSRAEDVALTLEVTYAGVDVRRVNTDRWISVRDRAVFPVGAGDQIRTNSTGRAYMRLDEQSRLLLLSNSHYRIDALDTDDGALTWHATLDGVAVQQVQTVADFRLQTRQLTLTSADGTFGIWSDQLSNDVVTVAAGTVLLADDADQTLTLTAGAGARYQATASEVLIFPQPLNRARLIGELDGCPAVVNTLDEFRGVLVRTGAGQGYQRRGLIEDSGVAKLLGRTQSGFWTRIQYGNGFGWVVSIAVTDDEACDLNRLPDNTPEEFILRALDPDPREQQLLFPFYGSPALDGWFYRYTDDETNTENADGSARDANND